tara:strand:+ start:109 stop:237 length:129 start_codon:yes stop_codon:yes gene_type:complete
MENSKINYLQNAKKTNGKMAMMGFFELIANYDLCGSSIPGIF